MVKILLTAFHPLSLHDALPICTSSECQSSRGIRRANNQRGERVSMSRIGRRHPRSRKLLGIIATAALGATMVAGVTRSEEHTSELQSRGHLVCRLLLEKKKQLT